MSRWLCLLLLLGLSGPIDAQDAGQRKSFLLVAKKNLPDPFFRDSVVLVIRHGGSSPVGVILNKPLDVTLSRLFADNERLRPRAETVFFGGPVDRQSLVVVFRAAAPTAKAIEVLDGIYMSASPEVLRELLARDNPIEGLRVYAGHAAWAPGQLEAEIERGSWYLAPADARSIFHDKPQSLWRQLESSMQLHHVSVGERVFRSHVLPVESGPPPHARIAQ